MRTLTRLDVGQVEEELEKAEVVHVPVKEMRMPVVKINAIEVPPDAGPELEKRFAHRAHAVDNQPGFLGFQLLRPVKGEDRYFVVTHWESEEAFQAWATGPAIEAHAGQRANPVATGASLLEFEVVLDVAGTDAKA